MIIVKHVSHEFTHTKMSYYNKPFMFAFSAYKNLDVKLKLKLNNHVFPNYMQYE